MGVDKDRDITGTNVFIDFEIIQKSNLKTLVKELDILIAAGKKIYLWSKTVLPESMKRLCQNTIISLDPTEKETHKKVYQMRIANKTYQEISQVTGIPIKNLSFYVKFDPDKPWLLSDWIMDYYQKDSSVYPKVDLVIDNRIELVEKFKKRGVPGNWIEKL